MYARILVPLDGSKLAEQVLPYVSALAGPLRTKIHLLQAFNPIPDEPSDPDIALYPHRVEENARAEAMAYLNQVDTTVFGNLGVPVICTVHKETPASWIVDEAEKEPGTLIAMCTHSRSGVARWVLGSVADKVLHATSRPVLLIRVREQPASAVLKLRHVLAPLDGSPLAEQSLPHVVALAKALDLTIILIQVTPQEDYQVRGYLRRIAASLQQQGVTGVEERHVGGEPASCIIDMSRQAGNSLVVMTTHGRSGIGRWLLGSVTDRVVRHSGEPVLVVRSHP